MLLEGQKQLAGQGSHTWARGLLEYVPAVQGCGCPEPPLHSEPGGQGRGEEQPERQYEPAGQLLHTVIAEAPVCELNVPAMQGWHAVFPTDGLNWPGGQEGQLVFP